MKLQPETWRLDAVDAATARLEIPADAYRERQFEIAVTMTVRVPQTGQAWHALRIEVDGQLQWSRRIPSSNPGSYDGLDYRFRRTVPVGRALRLLAHVDTGGGAGRLRLLMEAEQT